MAGKKNKLARKMAVQQMPLRSVYMLKKEFAYQKNNATLTFTLNLGNKKEIKDFVEILEKSLVDVKSVIEADTKGLIE